MASVAWTKLHSSGAVKGVLRHDCKDSRAASATHSNEDIQRDMTRLNTGVLDGYTVTARAYDERMAELPRPKRKDAVVGLGFTVPMPDGLPAKKEDEWAGKVYELMAEQYGKKNVVCFVIHRDEKHEYIDPDTHAKVMSRAHIQGVLVPESEGRLCAKEVTSRAKMMSINKAINEMTQRDYGLDFMDGSRAKSRGSVETLKQRSRRAELEQTNKKLEKKNNELEAMVDGPVLKVVYKKAQQRRDDADRAADEAETRRADAEAQRVEAERQAQEARQKAEEARQQTEAAQDTLEQLKAEAGDVRRSLSASIAEAENLKKYIEQGAQKAKPGDAGIIAILKAMKSKDGRSMYEVYQSRAAEAYRRAAEKQLADFGKRIHPAKRVRQQLNDITQPQQEDDGLSL